jgi:hypothetical protein
LSREATRTPADASPRFTAAQVAVARELAAYGRELAGSGAFQAGGAFTDLAAADELIKSSPEAFLLGVLFTQGIPAERPAGC